MRKGFNTFCVGRERNESAFMPVPFRVHDEYRLYLICPVDEKQIAIQMNWKISVHNINIGYLCLYCGQKEGFRWLVYCVWFCLDFF